MAWTNPTPDMTYAQALAANRMSVQSRYNFGTATGNNVQNATQLSSAFSYNLAADGANAPNAWNVYTPFTTTANYVFNANNLALTGTIPSGGGLVSGGINSGQILSNATYMPGFTGNDVYAFSLTCQFPNGPGSWPAFWLYPHYPYPEGTRPDGSEIDVVECYSMTGQDMHDYTTHCLGPGAGAKIYTLITSAGYYNNGTDYSAGFNTFSCIWTPDGVWKYINGTLIEASWYTFTDQTNLPQILINLAIGSSLPGLPGLQPVSEAAFPASYQMLLQNLTIEAGDVTTTGSTAPPSAPTPRLPMLAAPCSLCRYSANVQTTPYSLGALIANDATAANVIPLCWRSVLGADAAGTGVVIGARAAKSGTTLTGFAVRLWLFSALPVPTVGDGGVLSVSNIIACAGSGNFLGTVLINQSYAMTDGCASWGLPEGMPSIPFTSAPLYGLATTAQQLGATTYQAAASEQFTFTLLVSPD